MFLDRNQHKDKTPSGVIYVNRLAKVMECGTVISGSEHVTPELCSGFVLQFYKYSTPDGVDATSVSL